MKLSIALTFTAAASSTLAAYSGDIVQYWVDQSGLAANGSIIGGLQSPPSGWFEAVVQAAVYSAALDSQRESLSYQQLAVSHAAHNTLLWVFHGTRLYPQLDRALKSVLGPIGTDLDPKSTRGRDAERVGRAASRRVIEKRADDGINDFVDYEVRPAEVGVYQPTPGGMNVPDTPQAQFIRLFAGLGDVTRFRARPPPSARSREYEGLVVYVKEIGEQNSTRRTAEQTETAYFWRESSPIAWNRLAHQVVRNTLANDVVASAKFYAQLNYALANAAIASWDTKYFYNAWRPVTAIRRPGVWLATGRDISQPNWTPLLSPTPNHQDYLSTHATFGGAAAAVIKAWNNGDRIDIRQSSNITNPSIGVVTRRFTSLDAAAKQNGDSRVLGGIHFQFASDVGREIGDRVGRETLRVFDQGWDEF